MTDNPIIARNVKINYEELNPKETGFPSHFYLNRKVTIGPYKIDLERGDIELLTILAEGYYWFDWKSIIILKDGKICFMMVI